jgi:hypothetical protein
MVKQPFKEINRCEMLIGIVMMILGILLVTAGTGSFALTTFGSCLSIGLIVIGCAITVKSLH